MDFDDRGIFTEFDEVPFTNSDGTIMSLAEEFLFGDFASDHSNSMDEIIYQGDFMVSVGDDQSFIKGKVELV